MLLIQTGADCMDRFTKYLKNVYETALSGADGEKRYILQVCDVLRQNKLKKDLKENKKSIDKIFKDLAFKITNPDFWKDNKNMTISGPHGGYVGKTGDGLKIIKRDVNRSDRVYFVRYYNPENQKTYVRLLGYQLKGERKLKWQHEVKEIKRRYRGEIFSFVKEFVPDSSGGQLEHITEDSHILQTHGGYISIDGEVDLTENYIDALEHEANIIITDDQFRQIAKQTPLLIDGHAGTGKSIIIALRIAIHYANYDTTPENRRDAVIPSLLVVAYNERVLRMIERYAHFWIKKMIPTHSQKYIDRIEYIPTLRLYHMLLNEVDNQNIIDPTLVESTKVFVNFYRFQTEFFNNLTDTEKISAEQAWHFIRGILKGRELGWHGDEEITINDFGSVSGNPDAKVARRATDKMPRELIQSLISIHKDYEKWRKENNYLDDIDLVRRSLGSIKKDNSLKEDFITKFHTVLIDEGQDLTIVEFKLLTYLLKEYSDKVNIVVGGDPLQTINPTGFSWENLETFITEKVIEDSGRRKFDISPSRMLVSHRMPKPLVEFSNVIISARARISNEKIDLMKALDDLSDDGIITKVAYDVGDDEQRRAMNDYIASALGSDIGTIIWARDSKELESMKKKDTTITDLVIKSDDDQLMNEDIHSIESVKGLEFETVILYRFGDLSNDFSSIINASLSEDTDIKDDEIYEQLYFLNRLFIASTRSKVNLIIIDSDESMESCWNEKLWKGRAHNTLPIGDFVEIYKTPPTLNKANNYYEKGIERGDRDLLHKALASAKQCPESVERKELIINIEITILEREINTPNISEQEKLIKREKLIQLYEETGDLQKAIYERVILEKWDRIYEIKANKRNFKLIWTIAAFISTGNPEYRDSMIDMYSKHIKHVHNQDAKRAIEKTFRRVCRENLQSMNNKRLGKIQERFDWDEWIEILEPKWLPRGNIVENKKLAEQFEERMKLKFGNQRSNWQNNAYIMILNIEINNPDGSDKDKAEIVNQLASKGDTDAVRNAISSIFNEKGSIPITSKKWLTIKKYIDVASSNLEISISERKKLVNRLNNICKIISLNTEEFAPLQTEEEWLEAIDILEDIRKNLDINSAGMQEISFVNADVYTGLLNILIMDENNINLLVKHLLLILIKSNTKRRSFVSWNWDILEQVLNYFESFESLNVDTSDLHERILDMIAADKQSIMFSPKLIRFILKATDETRYKQIHRRPRLVKSLQILFEKHGWYDWYWKYPGTIYPWVIAAFTDDLIQKIPYKGKLQFHLLVRNWKDEMDVDIDDLCALCQIPGYADRELQLEIKRAANFDELDLVIDMIQTMDIEQLDKLSYDEIISVLNNNQFNFDSIVWSNCRWFSSINKGTSFDYEIVSESLHRIIHQAIYNTSFAAMVINVFPQNIDSLDNKLPKDLLNKFWNYITQELINRVNVVNLKSPFFELMMRDGNNISDSLKPATRRGKDNYDINALAVVDILTTISKFTNMKKRVEYLNRIDLLQTSTFSSNDKLKEALFGTDLFKSVFVEEEDLLQSAKNLF